MKNIKYIITILMVLLICTQTSCMQTSQPENQAPTPTTRPTQIPKSPQADALTRMEANSVVLLDADFRNGFPSFIKGSFFLEGEDPIQRAQIFLETYAGLYGLENAENRVVVKRLAGEEHQHVIFFQTYGGIPVYGGELVVYQQGDAVIGSVGTLYTPGGLSLEATIPAQQAEKRLREELNIPADHPTSSESTLMIYDSSLFGEGLPDGHLVWRVSFGGEYPWLGFVDAHNGDILEKNLRRRGILHTIPFTIRDYEGFPHGDADCYNQSILADYYIADDTYFDHDYDYSLDATQGQRYIRDTYNFFKNSFSRLSFDGADLMDIPIILYVSWTGAWYLPECMVIEFSEGYVGDDTMTHEFTHGVLEATSGLFLSGQSGSLNVYVVRPFGT